MTNHKITGPGRHHSSAPQGTYISVQLDMLAKWLGPQSAEQAKRLRAVYIHNAEAGVEMVWQRLEESYGAPEIIEHALLKKLENFPHISNTDNQRLREFGDLLLELDAAKSNELLPGLLHLDTAHGISPILIKLPYRLQEKWVSAGSAYKWDKKVAYPPFHFFVNFIMEEARIRNDPSFACVTSGSVTNARQERLQPNYRTPVSVKKTEVATVPEAKYNFQENTFEDPDKICPIHNKPHPLRKCHGFRNKPLEERKAYLKEQHICYRWCASTRHMAKDCEKAVQCKECDSTRHITALHPGPPPTKENFPVKEDQGGENNEDLIPSVTSTCTEIYGNSVTPKSCSKMCLVRAYPAGQREKAVKMYAVLNEQSNRSLAKTDFFNLFGIKSDSAPYTLRTCSGVMETAGRRACNFIIESLDMQTTVPLPTLIECDMMPDDRSAIPSPEIIQHHPHLAPLEGKIPAVDPNAAILILLGRDIIRVHKVREQYNGPDEAPYAQRLDLGWVIVGEVCLEGADKPENINVFRNNLPHNERETFLSPCSNTIRVSEKFSSPNPYHGLQPPKHLEEMDNLGSQVFQKAKNDDKPGLSPDDQAFLHIMNKELYKDESNTWVAPLPFRSPRHHLSNNREQASKRRSSLYHTQKRDVISAPPGDFNVKDIHSKQWRQVQLLSDRFWKRWKQEYLSTIQPKRKWYAERPNLQVGDLVLLKDGQVRRNERPTGLIVKSINSHDNKVRKVDVKIIRQGTPRIYTRSVSEVVFSPL
ncbi:uncharacterized protein [Nerophis lumbriciformis]|uniref:uncharacterized protein n=1 Tax=Nerophis lumbriciformis TaxID=546530 RepID=UPI003BAAAB43